MKVLALVTFVGFSIIGWFVIPLARDTSGEKSIEKPKLTALISNPSGPPTAIKLTSAANGNPGFAEAADFLQRLSKASSSDCQRWLEMLPDYESRFTPLILERWAEIDPHGAAAAVRAEPKLDYFGGTVMRVWASSDLEGALDAAVESRNKWFVRGLITGAGTERAGELVDLLTARGGDFKQFEGLIVNLAESDPQRAAELAMKGKFASGSGYAFEKVLGTWAQNDPQAALAWADQADEPDVRERLLVSWLGRDPLAALQVIRGDPKFLDKLHVSHLPIGKMEDEAFAGLLDWAATISDDAPTAKKRLFGAMLSGLFSGDHPERLAELADGFSEVGLSGSMAREAKRAVANWARIDEDGLVEFINSVEHTGLREAAVRGLIEQLARSDPQRALQFLNTFDEPVRNIDLSPVWRNLLERGVTMQEVYEMMPEGLRDESLDISYGVPAETSAQFVGQLPSGRSRDRAMSFSAGRWARQDPQAAAEWLAGLPDEPAKEHATGNIASIWATVDLEAASEWASGLEDPASRARAQMRVAEAAANSQPLEAVAIAEQIGDPKIRGEALVIGLIELARVHPALALERLGEIDGIEMYQGRIESAAADTMQLHDVLQREP